MSMLARTWATVGTVRMRQDPDEALVSATKAGHVEAFSELVRRHERAVFNLAFRFLRDAGSAEDMAQEAFLKAFRLLKGFRGECSFSTWLYRVTCNVCLTELHRRRKRGELALEAAAVADRPDSGAAMEKRDLFELVRRCVATLPDPYATVVALYYFEGTPYEEIADVMQVPLGTLKTWMHRAREQLRGLVEREVGKNGTKIEG